MKNKIIVSIFLVVVLLSGAVNATLGDFFAVSLGPMGQQGILARSPELRGVLDSYNKLKILTVVFDPSKLISFSTISSLTSLTNDTTLNQVVSYGNFVSPLFKPGSQKKGSENQITGAVVELEEKNCNIEVSKKGDKLYPADIKNCQNKALLNLSKVLDLESNSIIVEKPYSMTIYMEEVGGEDFITLTADINEALLKFIKEGRNYIFDHLAKESYFKFKLDKEKNLDLTETLIIVHKDTGYEFPNGEIFDKVPTGAKLIYKDGRVKIDLPNGLLELSNKFKGRIEARNGPINLKFKDKEGNEYTIKLNQNDGIYIGPFAGCERKDNCFVLTDEGYLVRTNKETSFNVLDGKNGISFELRNAEIIKRESTFNIETYEEGSVQQRYCEGQGLIIFSQGFIISPPNGVKDCSLPPFESNYGDYFVDVSEDGDYAIINTKCLKVIPIPKTTQAILDLTGLVSLEGSTCILQTNSRDEKYKKIITDLNLLKEKLKEPLTKQGIDSQKVNPESFMEAIADILSKDKSLSEVIGPLSKLDQNGINIIVGYIKDIADIIPIIPPPPESEYNIEEVNRRIHFAMENALDEIYLGIIRGEVKKLELPKTPSATETTKDQKKEEETSKLKCCELTNVVGLETGEETHLTYSYYGNYTGPCTRETTLPEDWQRGLREGDQCDHTGSGAGIFLTMRNVLLKGQKSPGNAKRAICLKQCEKNPN